MKTKIFYFLIILLAPIKSFAYTTLSGINNLNLGQPGEIINPNSFGGIVKQYFYLGLAVVVALAVYALMRGGFEYMTSSDNAEKKGRAKNRMWAAIGGLVLAVSSTLILTTINPQITNNVLNLSLPEPKKSELETVKNSMDIDKFLSDGLQESDAFLSGENQSFANKINEMSDKELVEFVNKQLNTETGEREYREFLLGLLEDRDFYQNGNYTNNPSIRNEIERMNNLLRKFSSIDSQLSKPDIYKEAAALSQTRKFVGLTDNKGQWLSSPKSFTNGSDFISSNNFNMYTLLFALDDTKAITTLYNLSGGESEKNSFSSSIAEVLNTSENLTEENSQTKKNIGVIKNWVDENGDRIGIKIIDGSYSLEN